VELEVEIVDAKEGLFEGLGHVGVQASRPDDVSERILRQPGDRKSLSAGSGPFHGVGTVIQNGRLIETEQDSRDVRTTDEPAIENGEDLGIGSLGTRRVGRRRNDERTKNADQKPLHIRAGVNQNPPLSPLRPWPLDSPFWSELIGTRPPTPTPSGRARSPEAAAAAALAILPRNMPAKSLPDGDHI